MTSSSSFDSWTVVVLAAGQGKRMRSSMPKVLHPIAGRPMAGHVLHAARDAGFRRRVVVVGVAGEAVRAALGDEATFVDQSQPLGTAHALSQAESAVDNAEHLLVLNGDVPLITPGTLSALARHHAERGADLSFLTARVNDAAQYGVIERDEQGNVIGVVEMRDREGASEGPAEINSGQYCFRAAWLWPCLSKVPRSAVGEFYVTSLIALGVDEHAAIQAIVAEDADETRGINDRVQLAEAEAVMRARINRRHMLEGVSIADPSSAYIDAGVTIGRDTMIEPNTYLRGATAVGEACVLGPNTMLRDAVIGDRCRIVSTTIEESTLEDAIDAGPYSHLRPGTHVGAGAHIGNFAEMKNARLGAGVKMGHFSYVGDAEVGENTNIGAGAITCNFDGEAKHRTVIGRDVFIGSDTMLVAPVTIGDGARTGAGSVVTKDVPPGAVAVGAPARIVKREDAS